MLEAANIKEVPMVLSMNPRYRVIIIFIVGLIAITAPIWAGEIFDEYLKIYSISDREKLGLLLLQEQRQNLDQACPNKIP